MNQQVIHTHSEFNKFNALESQMRSSFFTILLDNKKIGEIKKYYSSINNDENYEQSLLILAGAKKEIFEFFDNKVSTIKNDAELISPGIV